MFYWSDWLPPTSNFRSREMWMKIERQDKYFWWIARGLRIFHANFAATHTWAQITGLKGLLFWFSELIIILDRSHPETELVCVIVTVSFGTVTLDERSCAEIFQTRARTWQRLATSFWTSSSMLKTQNSINFTFIFNRLFELFFVYFFLSQIKSLLKKGFIFFNNFTLKIYFLNIKLNFVLSLS